MVVADEEAFRILPVAVAVHRAGQALVRGDLASTRAHARRAQALSYADNHLGRAAAAALIGLASWGSGDLEVARAAYVDSMLSMERAGHVADVLGLAIALSDIQAVQGRLRDARHTLERALRLAETQDGPVLRGTADMLVGLAALHVESDDLQSAKELLARSHQLGEHLGLPQNPYRWRVVMARVRAVEGDLDAAVGLLDDAERVYVGDFSPDVRPMPARRARMWIAQGRLPDAFGWVAAQGLTAADELTYLREFEHVTLARALLARCRIDGSTDAGQQAWALLQRLLAAADEGGRTGTSIEILLLQALTGQALARQSRGNLVSSLEPLERALVLAEPQGYVRIFIDEGEQMLALLNAAGQRGIASGYVHRLLATTGAEPMQPKGESGLVEPLSDRELDVLRLLASDLAGPDIARELVLSLNTVRTHTKNIYTKLGVSSRRAAVSRAMELDLLRTRR